ncbi:RecQ family ATP-dependent DNA helicase [Flavobacterium litorale]|uniref:ATP-dependent DNA helicase RecQ n=1 Tax=Flavobacterium litorale TaxID=2856519 RepID=A0ABX8VCB3_9FLAO|nr:ATP-dependent DNA helicase RecQ [Flavobacterium litorale]QYJ68289.1 RecQ family ATP-dependent DNA helicase [Flavobacterium litorale]
MQQPLEILKKYWQYDNFRDPQDKIIQSVLDGKDTFGLMPTGGGKSVCFQISAMLLPGICLVVSPLIALMKDQVANLASRDIKAIALAGGLSAEAISDQLDNCKFGDYKFLYISPERLQADWIVDRIKELPINSIAIDEAHCVSQWGHDFRPAYLKIAYLKQHFPSVPFLALTASATKRVQDDVIKQLGLENPAVYKKSFARENIAYMVFETEDKLHKIQQILTKNPEPSIIYVRNRKSCHNVSQQLNALGYKATYYHGGLKEGEKATNMKNWLHEKVQVIVATNAFGMGIDKPNVKTVLHIQLPENIESYYQEAGRAGRNGEKSFALLLLNKSDITATENQFIAVLPDKKFLKNVYVRLNNYLQIAYGEGIGQTFPFNINAFCNQYNFNVVKTYHALQFLDRQGIVTLSKQFSEQITLQFLVPSKEVLRYISLNPADEAMLLAILRNYPGIFDMESSINSDLIIRKTKATEKELLALMQRLKEKQIINYTSKGTDSTLTFNEVREDDHTINRIAAFLEQQNKIKVQQFSAIEHYATNTDRCKSRLLLDYFGETDSTNCGICSYCIRKNNKPKNIVDVANDVLKLISEAPCTSRKIESELALTAQETITTLRLLLDNEKIKINTNNQYTLK